MSDAHEHDEKKKHGGGGHGAGHGGGGGHEEHEGAPEWLISFADNVTLMMGFFVILLAMNLKPASSGGGESKEPGHPAPAATPEVMDIVIAIREAFNNPVDPNSANPVDLPLIRRIIERSGPSQADQEGQIGREHDVRSVRPSSYFSPAGSVPFDDGSATLNESGRQALRQMHKVVRGHNLVIEARGHVSAAEAFGKMDRGLRLSYDRALAVAEALTSEGLPWPQLRVVACGDGERLLPSAYDEAGHRANQRVEIIVTDQIVKASLTEEDKPPTSGAPGHP